MQQSFQKRDAVSMPWSFRWSFMGKIATGCGQHLWSALPGSSTSWPTSINIKNRAEHLQEWGEKCAGFCPATRYLKSGKGGSRALSNKESPRQFPISLREWSFLRLKRNRPHARICLQTNPVFWYYCIDEEMTICTQLTCQARITRSQPWLQTCMQSKAVLLKVHWRLCKINRSKALSCIKLNFCEGSWFCSHFCHPLSSDKCCVGWEEVRREATLSFQTPFPWQNWWNFASCSVLKNYSLESWRWQETSRVLPVCTELPETVLLTVLSGKAIHTISRKLCFW